MTQKTHQIYSECYETLFHHNFSFFTFPILITIKTFLNFEIYSARKGKCKTSKIYIAKLQKFSSTHNEMLQILTFLPKID